MSAKGWTDNEKLGLLFQIIAKAGPIPWPELTLPEGRTQKACQVMVDKEKQKIKKATIPTAESASDDGEGGGQVTPAATPAKKRKAAAADGPKKPKKGKKVVDDDAEEKPRPDRRKRATPKKTVKAESDVEDSGAEGQAADGEAVKDEAVGEGEEETMV